MTSTTVIHHHGIQPEPAHLLLLIVGIAVVILASFLWGVHTGRTMRDDRNEPIEDASDDPEAPDPDDEPEPVCLHWNVVDVDEDTVHCTACDEDLAVIRFGGWTPDLRRDGESDDQLAANQVR